MTYFDDFDTYYLANTFTLPELRHEVNQAEIKMRVSRQFTGTPFEDDECRFPWLDFAFACHEAIRWIQHSQSKSQPAAPSHCIDVAGVKARNDIVSVIEGYTQLLKSGHNRFTGRCPIHEDKHPSLTVYADNQRWHCFQCNRGGDIFDFIMAVNSCDFKQAAAILGGT